MMADLIPYLIIIFLTSNAATADESIVENVALEDVNSDVKIETIAKWSHCEKSFELSDVALFDVDIWYQVGDRLEYSLSEGEEKQPYTITLGKTAMLKPIEQGVKGMCVGEKRKITIPPHLAFGNKTVKLNDGRELIGGATVIAELSLIQIVRNTEEENKKSFKALDTDEDGQVDLKELRSKVDVYKKMLDEETVSKIYSLLADILETADTNSDGSLSYDEFVETKGLNGDETSAHLMKDIMKNYIQTYARPTKVELPCAACPTKKQCPPLPPCQKDKTKCNSACAAYKNLKEDAENTNIAQTADVENAENVNKVQTADVEDAENANNVQTTDVEEKKMELENREKIVSEKEKDEFTIKDEL